MNRVIEIIVSPQGETRVETKGFAGNECQQASRFLEEALGKRPNRSDRGVLPFSRCIAKSNSVTTRTLRRHQRGQPVSPRHCLRHFNLSTTRFRSSASFSSTVTSVHCTV